MESMPYQRLSKADFLNALNWLKERWGNWQNGVLPGELMHTGVNGRLQATKDLLEIMEQQLSGLELSEPAIWSRVDLITSPNQTRLTKLIQFAAPNVGLSAHTCFSRAGGDVHFLVKKVRPKPRKTPRPRNHSRPRSRIRSLAWFKQYACGEYLDLMLQAADFEAERNDASFHLIEPDLQEDLLPQARQAIQQRGNTTDRRCAVVLDLIDPADMFETPKNQFPGLRLISTGYGGATIAQDNIKIGHTAASALIASLAPYKKAKALVAILSPDTTSGWYCTPILQRIKAFLARFRHESRQHQLTFEFGEYFVQFAGGSPPQTVCTDLANLVLNALNSCDVVGVFSTMGFLSTAFIPAFYQSPAVDRIKIVSADITPTLIAMLADEHLPLNAICGVNPIHYGRHIVRTALNTRSDPLAQNLVAPRLVMQQEVLQKSLPVFQASFRHDPPHMDGQPRSRPHFATRRKRGSA